MFYRKQFAKTTKRLTALLFTVAVVAGSSLSVSAQQPPPTGNTNQNGNQGGATANPQPLQGAGNDLLNRNNSHPFFNPANIRQDYTYADPNNAPFVTREVHPEGRDEVVDRKSVGPGEITLHDVYKWPVNIPTATSPLPTKRDEGIGDHQLKTWGYPVSDTQYQMLHRYNQNIMLSQMFDPERVMWTMGAMGNMQMQNTADSAANLERNQAASAIDFTASYLYNFTVDQGNRWNRIRDQLFIPMAILILLPGAVLAQVKAIVSAGTPVIQDVSSPFEGILRSIVAIFLIPATYLVINYGIDVANSITYTIASEYKRIFGSDMYKDALCLHIRAFPIRMPHENDNGIFRPPTQWDQLDPKGPRNQTPAAVMEGQTTSNMLEDPCAETRIVPPERTNEAAPFLSTTERAMMGISNAGLAATWNILCAFQMAYLYYLWCVGPVVAALWVWPSKQLREALPSWTEGVVTLCFWSLFWNTVVLLMACFRGVDDTGSVITAALLFLANAAVKHAFDFAGLVKAAGQAAAGQALGQAGKMGQSAGAGVGASKGSSPHAAAAHSPSGGGHTAASAGGHPAISTGTTSGSSVGSSHSGAGAHNQNPFQAAHAAGALSGGGYGYSGGGADGGMGGGGVLSPGGSFSAMSLDGGGGGFSANAGFVPPPIAGQDSGAGPAGFFGVDDSAAAVAAAGLVAGSNVSYTNGGGDSIFSSSSFGGGSSFHSPSYHAFSNASHAAFNNHHMNAMHALHANFGAGTGGHGHGHGVTPPGMNSKEAAQHMLALQHAQQHMNDLKLHAPQIDMSANHQFSANFSSTLGGLDTSYNTMNQQMMALAAANPQQFGQFTNSDGTLDYARMSNSADVIDFDQLNVSDTDYNSMATSFSDINASTMQAESLARDVQNSAMQQALGQQQAQVQQQVQAEQNRLMQEMMAGTAPGQQEAVQQAMQQQQQQQQQEIQQLLARQAQDSMQVAQQLQQQYQQNMQGPNAQGTSADPAVQAQMQQQAQQQAQQAWQQHVQEQQSAVQAQMQQQAQQMQQMMQQQQMQQAMQNNPALQQTLDQTQQNISQAVQTAMQQQQQAVFADVQTQLSRIASDAASSANVMAVGQSSSIATAGSVGSLASGVDTTAIAYGASSSVYQGDTINGGNVHGSFDGSTVYNPNYSYDVNTGQAYNDNAMSFTSYSGGTINTIDSSSTVTPPSGLSPASPISIDSSVVSTNSQIVNSAAAGGADIVASAGAQIQQQVQNQMEARAQEVGNAITAGYIQPSVIQEQQAGLIDTVAQNFQQNLTGGTLNAQYVDQSGNVVSAPQGNTPGQYIDQSGQLTSLARDLSAGATAAGAALGMSSLISGSSGGGTSVHYVQGPGGQMQPSFQEGSTQRVVDLQGRQLARNSYNVVDTTVGGAGPASSRTGLGGAPGTTPGAGQARYTPTTGGKHIAMRGGPVMGMPGKAGRVSGAALNSMRGQPGAGGPGSAFTRALGKGVPGQTGRPGAAGGSSNPDLARKTVSDPFGEVHLASLRNRSRSRDKKDDKDDLEEFGENMNWEI